MAMPAKGLHIRRIVRVAAAVERLDVIAFKAPGPPALPAPVAIAPEHGPPHGGPLLAIELGVVPTSWTAATHRDCRIGDT